ncbi:hypothetical protein KIH23_07245 [Flavobacterium sp. CYK-55]|uniref:hypothetical protein n=1 Tax=Flavobacterium sp. CYK-55 TaxID=2835529 RepID=UPI001BCF44D5|nr:hypothetical protein [Flavobacterium sp. CYK-55]MBS7787089.1 hypothetical protein [Flavobacterium sp. CYK-55]
MNKLFFLLCIFSITTLFSCKSNIDEKGNNFPIVSKNKLLVGWKTLSNDSVKVNIPKGWKPKKVEGLLLYIPLEKDNVKMYYVILKTDVKKISLKGYLKEIFKQVYNKNKDLKYFLKEFTFKDKSKCYSLELFTKEANIDYKIYSLIYLRNDQIYDFSYKILNDENQEAYLDGYRTFYNVAFSFSYKNENIINGEEFVIKDEKDILYDDL